MDERLRFVARLLEGEAGISRKTGYKIFNRYKEHGLEALSDRSRLWETAEILPQVDDFKNYIVNFEIGVEADLNSAKSMSLRVYLDDTYNNVPAAGRKKNDLKLVAAVAYKF